MKRFEKSFYTILFCLILTLQLTVSKAQTVVTVYPNDQHQTIKGWGTSLSWWANIAGYWGDTYLNDVAYQATHDLNMNVFRFNIGGGENPNCPYNANCVNGVIHFDESKLMPGYRSPYAPFGTYYLNNDARQIRVMDKFVAYRSNHDIITEVFSCSPPWWMTNSKCTAGGVNGSENLNSQYYEAFADYIASITAGLDYYHSSWNIKYIEPFNEPLSVWWKPLANVEYNSSGEINKGKDQEGCQFSSAHQADILWWIWKKKTDVYTTISDVGLASSDCNSVGESINNTNYMYCYDRQTYDGLSKVNTHTYSGSIAEKDQLYKNITVNTGKPIWQSETGPLNVIPISSWWDTHYLMAKRKIEDLRHLRCEVWCDWQLVSISDAWGLYSLQSTPYSNPTPSYSPTRGFYCRKQVNYFIKQGYTIVSTDNENTVAALSPDKKNVVFVIVNYSQNSVNYQLDLTRFNPITSFRTWRTSGGYSSSENCTEKTSATIQEKGTFSGNKIWYQAPAFSVTTFVAITSGIKPLLISPIKNQSDEGNLVIPKIYIKESGISRNQIISWVGIDNPTVRVYDIKGVLVYEKSVLKQNDLELSTSDTGFRSGMYIVKVFDSNISLAKKFLVK